MEAICGIAPDRLLLPSVFHLLHGNVVGGGRHVVREVPQSSNGVSGGGGTLWGIGWDSASLLATRNEEEKNLCGNLGSAGAKLKWEKERI